MSSVDETIARVKAAHSFARIIAKIVEVWIAGDETAKGLMLHAVTDGEHPSCPPLSLFFASFFFSQVLLFVIVLLSTL